MKFSRKKKVVKNTKVELFPSKEVLTLESIKTNGKKATKRMIFNQLAFKRVEEKGMVISPVFENEQVYVAFVSSSDEITVNKSRTMNNSTFYDALVDENELNTEVDNHFELVEISEDELNSLKETEDEIIEFEVRKLVLITEKKGEDDLLKEEQAEIVANLEVSETNSTVEVTVNESEMEFSNAPA